MATNVDGPTQEESVLADLRPEGVWRAFDGIRRIPRPSKKEERIVQHMLEWAAQNDFSTRQDSAGNLVISVPANRSSSAGTVGDMPTVVLQAHLDMVCEKNAGTEHDFERDPIEVRLDGDWVRAEGTTLGADNGLGVALAMAAATDPDLVHGPLELLLTLDEETGLNGARALDGSMVEGRLLVNLDAEEDDAIYIGCAGAAGVEIALDLVRQPIPSETTPFVLTVGGLRGGHSGIDIHRNRGNGLKILARLLAHVVDSAPELASGLVAIEGGDKANALAREASASFWLSASEGRRLETRLAEVIPQIEEQLRLSDPGLEVKWKSLEGSRPAKLSDAIGGEAADGPGQGEIARGAGRHLDTGPVPGELAERWIQLLDALPHGVLAMSAEIPGLVETSTNFASATTSADRATLLVSLRSSSNPGLDAAGQSVASIGRLAKATVRRRQGYPGWAPDPDSALVARTAAIYGCLFDTPPELRSVHAGVECGVIAQKLPGLDAVSIGPEILGAHSPDERVSVRSVEKIYGWLSALLEELAEA